MKWWDDLWLNESFADFICYIKANELSEYSDLKLSDFNQSFNNRKNWGYDTDEKVTTHPIYLDVYDTTRANSIFDGITYSKGASILKQLFFIIGEDNFYKNLGNYFEAY